MTADLTTLARGLGQPDDLARARHRVILTFPCVIAFAIACAGGAALEVRFGLWALALPVVLALLAVALGDQK